MNRRNFIKSLCALTAGTALAGVAKKALAKEELFMPLPPDTVGQRLLKDAKDRWKAVDQALTKYVPQDNPHLITTLLALNPGHYELHTLPIRQLYIYDKRRNCAITTFITLTNWEIQALETAKTITCHGSHRG